MHPQPAPLVRVASPDDVPIEVIQALADHQRKEAERIRKYGHVRPTIAIDHKDHKVVAVGNSIHWSKSWKTFHDFLINYLGTVLGKEWGQAELAKPFEERHPVVQWYHHLCEFQQTSLKEKGTVTSAIMTGPVKAYLALAYDLYTLQHHVILRDSLVKRLKIKDQFQGARYEVYVCAACIRAGFDVALEDEGDGSTTHCEFVATHRATGLKYSVEAKSRHRPGLLGQAGDPKPVDQTEQDVIRLARRALGKGADHPRIIFIDVNMPPHRGGPFEALWFQSIARRLRLMEDKHSKKGTLPPAFAFFTNHPYHYVGNDEPEPGQTAFFTAIGIPDFRQPNPAVMKTYPALDELSHSVFNHTEIPHEFPQ